MSCELLNKRNIRPVQEQVRAIGVPEHMRRQMLFNARLDSEVSKDFGNIVRLEAPGEARGNKESLAIVLPAVGMDAVSYTHLDVYKRQVVGKSCTASSQRQ